MKTSTLIRWSGLAAILGGVLLIPGAVNYELHGTLLDVFLPPMLIFGLIGVYAVQVEQSGWFGLLGFMLSVFASIFTILSFDIGGVPVGAVAIPLWGLGILLFAIGTLSSGKFPRWIPWLWIAAIVIGLPSLYLTSAQVMLGALGSIAWAVGFAGAGYQLWSA